MIIKILLTIIFAIISSFVFQHFLEIYNNNKNDIKVVTDYKMKDLNCSLNLQSCNTVFKNKIVNFDITPKPVRFMDKTTVKIKGLQGNYDKPNLKIYGLNMNTGIIKANIVKKSDGYYESYVSLSSCLMGIMRYRAEVFDGDKSIGLFVDFDLERK